MTRALIKNGYVITVDHRRSVYPGGFVLIDGSKIEAVGSSAELPRGAFDRTIDAHGMAVIPGLINAHQHFYYHLFKGLGHGLLLEDWFPHLVCRLLLETERAEVRIGRDAAAGVVSQRRRWSRSACYCVGNVTNAG